MPGNHASGHTLRIMVFLVAILLAGCTTGGQDSPTNDPDTENPSESNSPSATDGPGPAPTEEERRLEKSSLEYTPLVDPQPELFEVPNGTSSLQIWTSLNVTSDGTYLLSQSTSSAELVLYAPDEAPGSSTGEWRASFMVPDGGEGQAGEQIQGPFTGELQNPPEGTWSVHLSGLGENLQVDFMITGTVDLEP